MGTSIQENVFGSRLKTLRKILGYTQKQFAETFGIPQSTLSYYESAKAKPTIEGVETISEKTGMSIDWLLGHDRHPAGLTNLGDVVQIAYDLFETREFGLTTTVHDKVDFEADDANSDDDRNWISIKMYFNEARHNPERVLNADLCRIFARAYNDTQKLRNYETSQEAYNREKEHWVEYYKNTPITKVDFSGLSDDERREKLFEILKAEHEKNQ